MKRIHINILDMQSTHCMKRVKDAVSAIDGVQIEGLSAGDLKVSMSSDSILDAVLDAIVKAGYTVSAEVREEVKACHTGCSHINIKTMSKEVFKYKTNINCGSCVANVKSALDELPGVCHWQVDVANPSKILTIESEGLFQEEIIETVRQKGYKIEPLN